MTTRKKKEKLTKIKLSHVVTGIHNGKIAYQYSNVETNETLEELRNFMRDEVDYFIDSLLKTTKGHITTHGVVVHPMIHIIHDDQALDDTNYQSVLREERRKERKDKLQQINEKQI